MKDGLIANWGLLGDKNGPKPLGKDNREIDRKLGTRKGADVCGWYDSLVSTATNVNLSDLSYPFLGLRQNSTSVLREMLGNLPDHTWYGLPRMIGSKSPFRPNERQNTRR